MRTIRKIPKTRISFLSNVVMRIECSCVGIVLVFAAFDAGAQAIEMTPGDCRAGVHLVAREARLVDVLKRLAQALHFELRYEGDEARVISVSTTRPAVELISSLSQQDSIIVTQAKDPQCPGANRVVKVWVLPTAQATARERPPVSAAPSPPAATPTARPTVTEQVIRGSAALEEQSRRAKAAYDEYVRVHGVAPPGAEEEAAKK